MKHNNYRNGNSYVALLSIILVLVIIVSIFVILPLCNNKVNLNEYHVEEYVVKSGDTFWSICEETYPNEDIREWIHITKTLNNNNDSVIYPGEVIYMYIEN